MNVAGRVIAPKEVYTLIPGTCDYVALRGKNADVIKSRA